MEFKPIYLFGIVILAVLAMLIFVITVEVIPCNKVELFDPNIDVSIPNLHSRMRRSMTATNGLIDKFAAIFYAK
jgi:hypothetical protein